MNYILLAQDWRLYSCHLDSWKVVCQSLLKAVQDIYVFLLDNSLLQGRSHNLCDLIREKVLSKSEHTQKIDRYEQWELSEKRMEQKNQYLLKKLNLSSRFTQWKEKIPFLETDQSGQVSNSLATVKVQKKHTESEIQVRKLKVSIRE